MRWNWWGWERPKTGRRADWPEGFQRFRRNPGRTGCVDDNVAAGHSSVNRHVTGARFLEINAGHAVAGLNGPGQRIHIERGHICSLEIASNAAKDAVGLVPLKERNAVGDGDRRIRRRLDRINAGQRHSSHECRDDEWRRAWEELSDSMHRLPFPHSVEWKGETCNQPDRKEQQIEFLACREIVPKRQDCSFLRATFYWPAGLQHWQTQGRDLNRHDRADVLNRDVSTGTTVWGGGLGD